MGGSGLFFTYVRPELALAMAEPARRPWLADSTQAPNAYKCNKVWQTVTTLCAVSVAQTHDYRIAALCSITVLARCLLEFSSLIGTACLVDDDSKFVFSIMQGCCGCKWLSNNVVSLSSQVYLCLSAFSHSVVTTKIYFDDNCFVVYHVMPDCGDVSNLNSYSRGKFSMSNFGTPFCKRMYSYFSGNDFQ